MIYTNLRNVSRYLGLHPNLDTAIREMLAHFPDDLGPGRHEIDGDRVFLNRFNYDTIPLESAIWEGHKHYADMHLIISGKERIGVSDAAALTAGEYRENEDFVPYEGPVQTNFDMEVGDVLIVYPEDVHMVKLQSGESCAVRKGVYKIKL